jgi:hypothetical protein
MDGPALVQRIDWLLIELQALRAEIAAAADAERDMQ